MARSNEPASTSSRASEYNFSVLMPAVSSAGVEPQAASTHAASATAAVRQSRVGRPGEEIRIISMWRRKGASVRKRRATIIWFTP